MPKLSPQHPAQPDRPSDAGEPTAVGPSAADAPAEPALTGPPAPDPHPSPGLHGASGSSTARLAGWCARHAWPVVVVWLLIAGAGAYLALGIGSVVSADEMDFLNQPESARAEAVAREHFGRAEGAGETIVVTSDLTVDDPAYQAFLSELTADLAARTDVVTEVYSYPVVAALRPDAADALVSPDRHATILPVTLIGPGGEGSPEVDSLAELDGVLTAHADPRFWTATVGAQSVGETFMQTAEEDLLHAELLGLPVTLLVLVAVFGALVAAGVSMLLAGVSIITAIGLAALVGRVFDLSFFVVNMISMIGLAVGIDYALFIIARYREERQAGAERRDAIVTAGGTASRAVLFSGVTVVLALLGLYLVPISTFRSLGLGATLVVAVAVVAMLTLVPALLALIGDGVDRPRLRLGRLVKRRGSVAEPVAKAPGAHGHAGDPYTGWWGRVAHLVMVRPVISVSLAAGLLLVLAVPFLGLERGSAGAETLPPGTTRDAYQILERDFSAGLLSPVEVVVAAEQNSAGAVDSGAGPAGDSATPAGDALDELGAVLVGDPAFVPQPRISWSPDGAVGRLVVPLALQANSDAAYDAIDRLRADYVPAAFAGVDAEVLVGGETAEQLDSFRLIGSYTPWVFAFVLGLSFLLLLVAFRSLVVPLKAIVMNLLSVGAAYGVLVLVFQEGWLIDLFGFQRTPAIEAWVPIFLFCILFGLSMDYHVFLLSRIREHFDVTGRNAESVAVGLRSTGRIITGAAAIMVVVFGTFAAGRLVMMQQVGFGLAVAVFLDATVVRSVLVPSTMALLGGLNWYLPRWLRWLPDLRIEGTPPTHLRPDTLRAPEAAGAAGAGE